MPTFYPLPRINITVCSNIALLTDRKKLGKFSEGKDQTLIAKIDSDYAKRLILLSLRKMKDYRTPVFISKELNPKEQKIENELLQKRREKFKKMALTKIK